MNWNKLKEKFPKAYKELREFSDKTNTDGYLCMTMFLESKGFNIGHIWINQLVDYENSLWIDINGRIVEISTMSDRWLNNIRKRGLKNQYIANEIKRRKAKRNKR